MTRAFYEVWLHEIWKKQGFMPAMQLGIDFNKRLNERFKES